MASDYNSQTNICFSPLDKSILSASDWPMMRQWLLKWITQGGHHQHIISGHLIWHLTNIIEASVCVRITSKTQYSNVTTRRVPDRLAMYEIWTRGKRGSVLGGHSRRKTNFIFRLLPKRSDLFGETTMRACFRNTVLTFCGRKMVCGIQTQTLAHK